MLKEINYKIKGMCKDINEENFPQDKAFDIQNMRLATTGDSRDNIYGEDLSNGTLAWINEKQPLLSTYEVDSKIVGTCIIGNNYVVFTKNGNIYTHEVEDGNIISQTLLYDSSIQGNLNLGDRLETLAQHENEKLQKVYWLDGKNQPRVINIKDPKLLQKTVKSDYFDFIKGINTIAEIKITKSNEGQGEFPAGTIQYCFCYYNQYNSQSNIFYTSPLYYNSPSDRGAKADETCFNSFKIELDNLDDQWEFVRVYSIVRSSKNATPVCKRVVDLQVQNTTIFQDNNTLGEVIDPTELLYIGGRSIVANTFDQKDNTLFLGNYKINNYTLSQKIKTECKNLTVLQGTKEVPIEDAEGYFYKYNNQLNDNSFEITCFKYNENYRLGLQFQTNTGEWSEVAWVKDWTNYTAPIKTTNNSYEVGTFKLTLSDVLLLELNKEGFLNYRPVVVFPELQDRMVIAQGIINPTMFNKKDRDEGKCINYSSWFFRPDVTNPLNRTKASDGKIAEFRHNYPVPDEIQSSEPWYVDRTVFTFHSPDLEFSEQLDLLEWDKYSIVPIGQVNCTASKSNVLIQSKTSVNLPYNPVNSAQALPKGFNYPHVDFTIINNNTKGCQRYIRENIWIDSLYTQDKNCIHFVSGIYIDGKCHYYIVDCSDFQTIPEGPLNSYKWHGFSVYPWHRSTSLNNQRSDRDGYWSSELDKKIISTILYSNETVYQNISVPLNMEDAQMFLGNEGELVKLKSKRAFGNNSHSVINYYGNVDKIIENKEGLEIKATIPLVYDESNLDTLLMNDGNSIMSTGYDLTYNNTLEWYDGNFRNSVEITDIQNYNTWNMSSIQCIKEFRIPDSNIKYEAGNFYNNCELYNTYTKDPVRMKYKSSKHLVLALNDNNPAYIQISRYGCFSLVDIFNDYNITSTTRFGGDTEEAIANNKWLVAGNVVPINEEAEWLNGDTYLQRYDCLKTYPYSNTDQNQIIEVASFVCESRVNTNGRSDRNRILEDYTIINPENYNLFNDAYTQDNNYFNYYSNNSNLIQLDTFNNSITWTKTKTNGELVDSWTNLTLASQLDLDGNKGNISKIKRYNDNIFAFQDKGISQILYNPNVQISTEQGIPIEIANSGKVQGKRYVLSTVGLQSQWAITEGLGGLYFKDNMNNNFYLFNGQLKDIGAIKGFKEYMVNSDSDKIFYDQNTNDIYLINKYLGNNKCLSFNESVDEFTSYYPYNINDTFINTINGTTLYTDDKNIYQLRKSDNYYDYSITLMSNDAQVTDKTWTNVSFKGDVWNPNVTSICPFNYIKSWNEYQKGESDLNSKYPDIRRKFRVWNIDIPRDELSLYKRDRMRSPWVYITLESKNTEHYSKIHDIQVKYMI